MRRESGMSLVEVLVGLVVGMISILSIYQMLKVNEDFRRFSIGGSGAQMSGGVATLLLQMDLQRAGLGIGDRLALGCSVNSNLLPAFPLVPVVIASAGAGTSDNVTVLYSTANAGHLAARTNDLSMHNAGDLQFSEVDVASRFVGGDMAIAWDGTSCPLFQITGVRPNPLAPNTLNCPGATGSIKRNALCNIANGWNSTVVGAPFPAVLGQYTQIFDFGRMVRRTYCVYLTGNPNGCAGAPATLPDASLISLDALDATAVLATIGNGDVTAAVPLNNNGWQVVAENVLQMKVEYGLNTAGTFDVGSWTSVTPVGQAAWAQVFAVRAAILVRASNPRKPDSVTGTCAERTTGIEPYTAATPADAFTNAVSPYFLGWAGLAGNQFTVPTNSDWQCYRYSVNQMVVPLRNMQAITQDDDVNPLP